MKKKSTEQYNLKIIFSEDTDPSFVNFIDMLARRAAREDYNQLQREEFLKQYWGDGRALGKGFKKNSRKIDDKFD